MGVSATVSTKPGFYFAYGLHTVDFGADGSKGQHQGLNLLTLGYDTEVGGVKIGVGGTKYLFVGSNNVNDLSFGEVFVRGSWNGLHAQLWRNIDGAKGDNSRLNNGDTYGSVGYSHQLGKFNVGADVGYYWYKRDAAVDGVSDATVHVGYSHNENLSVTATYLVHGNMPNGDGWNTTKFVLSASYAF